MGLKMSLSTLTHKVGAILSTSLIEFLFSGDSDATTDRRAYTRVRVRFAGSIDFEGRRIPVRGINLHRAGAGISLDEPLPVGTLVFFYGKTHGLMGWATVRWCSGPSLSKYCAGLEFRGSLMRAEAGNWQFSYVQSSSGAAGVPVQTN